MGNKATWKCVICDKPSTGHGNNPEPVRQMQEGQCCDKCARTRVWPARLESLRWMSRDEAIAADFDGYFDKRGGA